MNISLIHPSLFKLDGGAMFGIIPKPLWSKKIVPDEHNRISMTMRVVLIESNNRKVLIDTGIGDYHTNKFNQQFDISNTKLHLGDILSQEVGIRPEEITDIILTHLHFDHVGGLGKGESGTDLIFENATVHVHKKHLEYAQNSTLRDQGSFHIHHFMPILDNYSERKQLNLLTEKEGKILQDLEDCIHFRCSFGHTPYMVHPIFGKYIYMADLVPMSHHIRLPWVMGYDIEPGTTTIYKDQFYRFIMAEKLTMIFEHDIETWGGEVEFDEKGQYNLKKTQKASNNSIRTLIS